MGAWAGVAEVGKKYGRLQPVRPGGVQDYVVDAFQ